MSRRRISLIGLLPLLCLVAGPGPARADKYAAEFLKIGAGARALGMGEAFVAVADDGTAGYWNPAGLVFVERRELDALHAEQFGSLVNYDFLSYTHPLEHGASRSSVIGLTMIRSAIDDIPVFKSGAGVLYDVGRDGIPDTHDEGEGDGILGPGEYVAPDPGNVEFKSDTDLGFLLSYARPLSSRLAAGATAKIIRQQLIDNSSFGIGTDVGVMYTPNDWLTAGLRVADATTTLISWDTGRRETVQPSARAGLAVMRDVPQLQGVVTLAADADVSFDGGTEARGFVGAEYWYHRTFAIRLGDDAGNLAGGAGIRWSRFGLDYAFMTHEDLDTTQRILAFVRL